MVIEQRDEETGEILPSFGIENDPEGNYKRFKKSDTEVDAIYQIKAHASDNTEIYTYVQTQITSGKVHFLIDEIQAKNKLMTTKLGASMEPEARAEYLIPYTQTSILKEQMMNLVESTQGVNIILKQSITTIKKDKFSAFAYGMYYIKLHEDKKTKKRGSIKGLMLFTRK